MVGFVLDYLSLVLSGFDGRVVGVVGVLALSLAPLFLLQSMLEIRFPVVLLSRQHVLTWGLRWERYAPLSFLRWQLACFHVSKKGLHVSDDLIALCDISDKGCTV